MNTAVTKHSVEKAKERLGVNRKTPRKESMMPFAGARLPRTFPPGNARSLSKKARVDAVRLRTMGSAT